MCAVRVRVHFPQIQVEPRREQSAQNGIHHHHGKVILVQARNGDVSYAHLRLRRVGLVHQMHAPLRKTLGVQRLRDGRCLAGPLAEVRAGELHGMIYIDVADHHQRGGVGTIELRVICLHALARQAHGALFVATGQPCETRFRLVQQSRKEHIRQAARFGAQLCQIRQPLAAHPIEFRFGKRRIAQHLRQHRHGVVDA